MIPYSPPLAFLCFSKLILCMRLRLSCASGTAVVATTVGQHAILHPVLQGYGPVVAGGRIVLFLYLWVRCALVACSHFLLLLALESCGALILLDVRDRALVKKLSKNNWVSSEETLKSLLISKIKFPCQERLTF